MDNKMDDISAPPARKYLRNLFRDAAKIDIEVGYFTFEGWQEVYSVIPKNARIRMIIGMLPEESFQKSANVEESVVEAIAKESLLNKMDPDQKRDFKILRDIVNRLFEGSMQVRGHWKIHGKMYASKKRFRRPRIIVGTGNISKNALHPKKRFRQGNIWVLAVQPKLMPVLQNQFTKDWKASKDVSQQLLKRISKKLEEAKNFS
ncbi:MAG: hypothetical protein OXU78_07545 [Deltaproteobacteria bacterium]|nr:hypothetical protein [Deltaproteobacteria bacterium]